MKDLMDSVLIGTLTTYLPFWIIDSTVQRIVLAIGVSMMIYAGKLWQMERRENGNEAGKTYRKESEWQNLSNPRQQRRISQNGVAAGPDSFIRENCCQTGGL